MQFQIRINTFGIKNNQSLSPRVPRFPPGFKSLRNQANDDHYESTDNSSTDKDDTSRTDQDDYIDNLKSMENKNDDGKYKQYNLQHQNGNESVINKTKE